MTVVALKEHKEELKEIIKEIVDVSTIISLFNHVKLMSIHVFK